MSTTVTPTDIRSFQIEIPQEQIADLRRRITSTRWPAEELVPDRSQGVQLATLQALARYWADEYDWRKCEARLNVLPQFTTEIDGVEIHFIHVKSRHENAMPLIMTHGWPGSVVELLDTIGPLTDPTAHGGNCRGRVPRGAAVVARLRLLGRADRARLGERPHRHGVGRADAPPRLLALRRPGWRRGRRRHRRDGPPRRPRGCSASTSTCSRWRSPSRTCCRRNPRRNARRSRSSRRSRPTASATSWSRPPGRRRSATRCWTHRSGWRHGCSTTTRTATTRSPRRSSTASRWATSPGTTSSTTSPCTGSRAPAPRPPGGTGSSDSS